ncbi:MULTISPECIES: sigma-70 family RNA polymerase sigma factor [unclassified Streptomyces]|uniref:sigma-70 family RNA polymerase sigma factor n=1 Tax=unclassified Streptomyces TaxID=2593676 RepID=UPI0035D61AB3
MADQECVADQEGGRARRAMELGTLVGERYGQMVGLARKRLRAHGVPASSAEPEDIVQNALKSVLAGTGPIEHMRAYTYRVIEREAKRAVEHFYSGRGYASLDADVRLEDEPTVHPVAEAELRHVVAEAVSTLPRQQRRVMLLTQDLGLTQAEAARVLGAAPGTVGVHAHRAMVALRVSLVGLGVTLVAGTVGSMRFGVREIIPAAGVDTPIELAVARSLFITMGVVLAVLGLAIYLPGRRSRTPLRRMGVRLRKLLARLVDGAPERENDEGASSFIPIGTPLGGSSAFNMPGGPLVG